MHIRLRNEIDDYLSADTLDNREVRVNAWKAKLALRQQRRNLQKKIFGDHYNYSKVGLNKEKKFLLEEQKNTEIERSNRILLQKIQRISKRSVPIGTRKRNYTQVDDNINLDSESSSIKSKNYQTTNPVNRSYQQLQKITISDLKSARNDTKILFKGSKQCGGKLILIKTFIDNGKFTIVADFGRMKQKIYLDIANYRILFKEVLDADHSKILERLNFNGQIMQLKGVKKQKIALEQQEQMMLPPLKNKSIEKEQKTEKPEKPPQSIELKQSQQLNIIIQ